MRAGGSGDLVTLLERDSEVACLRSAGSGAVVISGPLGTGRSALLEVLAAPGVPFARVAPGPHEPFGVVRQLFGRVPESAPPLVLVDDAHLADEASLKWLLEQASAVVMTVRDGEPRPAVITGQEVRTRPLSASATSVLVRARFPGQDAAFAAECFAATGGNPFFLSALLLELATGVRPDVASARPAAVRDALRSWLLLQPAPVARLLRVMAVLSPGSRALCADLADVGCADVLRDAGLLDDSGFPLPIVRSLVEESMEVSEREELLLAVAELSLSRGEPVERVAARLMSVTSPLAGWAVDVLRQAADEAWRRGEPGEAARCLRRALVGGGDEAALLVQLAEVTRGVDPAAAVRHVARAAPLLSVRERAEAVVLLGLPALGSASFRDLVWAVERELGSSDTDLAGRLEARRRYSHAWGDAALVDAAERLAALPDAETAGERELRVVLLHLAAVGGLTRAAETVRVARQVLEREPPSPAHVHSTLPLLVTAFASADEPFAVAGWLSSALAASEPASLEHALIRLEQAYVLARTGREVGPMIDDRLLEWDSVEPALAWIALETGDRGLCKRLLVRDSTAPLIELLRAVESTADERVAVARALECGRTLDRAGRRNPAMFPWRMWVVPLCERIGDLDTAVGLAEEQRVLAVSWGAAGPHGRALRVLGELTGSLDLLRSAVELLGGSTDLVELELAHRALGRPREPVVPAREELTSYERRVAELAARGVSNLDIAAELGLSRRTVEKHLTSSYRKLGITGRSELVKLV